MTPPRPPSSANTSLEIGYGAPCRSPVTRSIEAVWMADSAAARSATGFPFVCFAARAMRNSSRRAALRELAFQTAATMSPTRGMRLTPRETVESAESGVQWRACAGGVGRETH